jgi:hypothetical protein|tara:strand:+ start:10686 stop:11165 length:480 start_codon:yes stop_codon:yes gene_type:complete
MAQYDEIIDCPKSGGDLCYKVEINGNVTNYMSISCGFWTNSLMKEGEEFFELQMSELPELYKDLAWKDPKTELIWLPNTINTDAGMIFADGKNSSDWKWAAVKSIPQYKVPEGATVVDMDKPTFKPDMSTIQHFKERDYMEALSYLNILPNPTAVENED